MRQCFFAARNYNDPNGCRIDKWVQAVHWYKLLRACDCVTNMSKGMSCKQVEPWKYDVEEETIVGGLACKANASKACKDKIKAIVDMYKNASNAPQCLEADKRYQEFIKFTIPVCT